MCSITNTEMVEGDMIISGDKLVIQGESWEVVEATTPSYGIRLLKLQKDKNQAKTAKVKTFASQRYRIVSR